MKRAVELYASAARYSLVASSRWFTEVSGAPIQAAAGKLAAQDLAKAEEHGRVIDPQALVAALLDDL